MRFIDLFAGLGGFNLAARTLGGRCVFASEIDPKLRELYLANHGIEPVGDIRRLSPRDVPTHDLLCAGFPCQPFSKAGGQLGWKDAERGSVFDKVTAILAVHHPEFVILENVAHFEKHDEGRTFRRVETQLRAQGYDVDKVKLSPHQFGVPHFRERLFVVARLGSLGAFRFPSPTTSCEDISIRDILDRRPAEATPIGDRVEECLRTWQDFLDSIPAQAKLPSFPIWGMEFDATYPYEGDSLHSEPLARLRACRGSFGQSLAFRFRREILERVPSHARAEANTFPPWKKAFLRQNREFLSEHRGAIADVMEKVRNFPSSLQKLEWNCQGEPRDLWSCVIQFRASGVRLKRSTTAPSLVAMTGTQVPIIGWERRYMTARECSRLQSMDELRHLPTGEAAVAALGNAVNVRVVIGILSNLLGVGASPLPKVQDHRGRLVS